MTDFYLKNTSEIDGFYRVKDDGNKYGCKLFAYNDFINKIFFYALKGHHEIYRSEKELKKGCCITICVKRKLSKSDINVDWVFANKVKYEIESNNGTLDFWDLIDLRSEESFYKKWEEDERKYEKKLIKEKLQKYRLKTYQLTSSKDEKKKLFVATKYPNKIYYCIENTNLIRISSENITKYSDIHKVPFREFSKIGTKIKTVRQFKMRINKWDKIEKEKFKKIKVYGYDSKFDFGKFDKWKLIDVLQLDPEYINWCVLYVDDFIFTKSTFMIDKDIKIPKFDLSKEAFIINEKKKSENNKRWDVERQYKNLKYQNKGSSWVASDEDTFWALTDGQYGSYDRKGGDISLDDFKEMIGL